MKAILVIDVPDDFETKTAIAIVDVKNEKGEGVTTMCPLKPAPSEYAMSRGDSIGDCAWFYGYNKCVREVVGDDSD